MGGMEWMWREQEALFLAEMVLEKRGFDSPRFGFDSSMVGLKNGSFFCNSGAVRSSQLLFARANRSGLGRTIFRKP